MIILKEKQDFMKFKQVAAIPKKFIEKLSAVRGEIDQGVIQRTELEEVQSILESCDKEKCKNFCMAEVLYDWLTNIVAYSNAQED